MQEHVAEHMMELEERLMHRIHGKIHGGVILLRLHELLRVTYSVT